MNKQIDKGSRSGDQVTIAFKNNRQVIIKRSKHNAKRLLRCAELQKTNRIFGENIFAVPVLRTQRYFDCAEIEMPYQHGLNGENLYLYGNPLKVIENFAKLTDAVHMNLVTAEQSLEPRYFHALAADKIKTVHSNSIVKSGQKIPDKLCSAVLKHLLEMLQKINVYCPVGLTHGDLTFSNIIIDPNYDNVWLIDYLDSFVASPYADFAKLIQEVKFGWSARYLSGPQAIQAKILRRHLFRVLQQKIEYFDSNLIHFFSVLNLFRIVPYLHDEKSKIWLQLALEEELKCTS